MAVFGFVITKSKFNFFVVLRVFLSFLFFASILLTIQLAKGLQNNDIEYLDKSIFRNLPIVFFSRKS